MKWLRGVLILAGIAVLLTLLQSWVGQEVYVQMVVLGTALTLWVYVLLYGFRSPWWKNQVGRSIMWQSLALALLLTLICLAYFLGDYPYRDLIRNVFYSSMFVAFLQSTHVLVRVQQGRERGEIPAKVQGEL